MNPKPRITFLFPYRWLKEDKEYFPDNVLRQIKKAVGGEDGINDLKRIISYSVMISYQSYLPVSFKLSKTEVQKILKPFFPHGKCLDVEIEYKQHRSRTMLPVFDFQLYF